MGAVECRSICTGMGAWAGLSHGGASEVLSPCRPSQGACRGAGLKGGGRDHVVTGSRRRDPSRGVARGVSPERGGM
jgi:hypothetical protein